MDNKVIDFSAFAAKRDAFKPGELDTANSLVPTVADGITKLIDFDAAKSRPRFFEERLRPYMDRWVRDFWERMSREWRVVVLTVDQVVDYDSLLMIEDTDGSRPVFPIIDFVRLTARNPANVLPESLDTYLLDTLSNWGIAISLRPMEGNQGEGYEEHRLDERTYSDFHPESAPLTIHTHEIDEGEYSCFFSDAEVFVSSVSAEHFEEPADMNLLDLMCLAYTDFLEAGNDLDSPRVSMNVELERECVGRYITIIPAPLLERVIGESVARIDLELADLPLSDRIWKYVQKSVLPRVNAKVYDEID